MKLLDNAAGNYRFLTGIAPYSAGVVAMPGYEIVHVTVRQPVPWRIGFQRIEQFLKERKRPLAALCAIELRSPAPFSFTGFSQFNAGYRKQLAALGLLSNEHNPIARTNVAPAIDPPNEPCLDAFSFTAPTGNSHSHPTFVVAGAGDLRDQADLRAEAIVRPGETSVNALKEKASVVFEVMRERLFGLGCDWGDCTTMNVYTALPLHPVLTHVLTAEASTALSRGVVWHYSYPPIQGLCFEMDLRGNRQEIYL